MRRWWTAEVALLLSDNLVVLGDKRVPLRQQCFIPIGVFFTAGLGVLDCLHPKEDVDLVTPVLQSIFL